MTLLLRAVLLYNLARSPTKRHTAVPAISTSNSTRTEPKSEIAFFPSRRISSKTSVSPYHAATE